MVKVDRSKRFELTEATPVDQRPQIWLEGRQQPRFKIGPYVAVSLAIAKRDLLPDMEAKEERLRVFSQRVQAGELRPNLAWAGRFARAVPDHERVAGWIWTMADVYAGARARLEGRDETAEGGIAYPDLIRRDGAPQPVRPRRAAEVLAAVRVEDEAPPAPPSPAPAPEAAVDFAQRARRLADELAKEPPLFPEPMFQAGRSRTRPQTAIRLDDTPLFPELDFLAEAFPPPRPRAAANPVADDVVVSEGMDFAPALTQESPVAIVPEVAEVALVAMAEAPVEAEAPEFSESWGVPEGLGLVAPPPVARQSDPQPKVLAEPLETTSTTESAEATATHKLPAPEAPEADPDLSAIRLAIGGLDLPDEPEAPPAPKPAPVAAAPTAKPAPSPLALALNEDVEVEAPAATMTALAKMLAYRDELEAEEDDPGPWGTAQTAPLPRPAARPKPRPRRLARAAAYSLRQLRRLGLATWAAIRSLTGALARALTPIMRPLVNNLRQATHVGACWALAGLLMASATPGGAVRAMIYHLDGGDLSDWS